MLVLLGEWCFFSHHPAYRCFSRVPVCVCVCGKVRLLMIVDTRDTVPYHSSCTMGCSWSRPTMKTSIRLKTGMRPLEPVWKVTFGLVASVHFCRLIVIMWARVANLQPEKNRFSFRMKTQHVGKSLSDSKGSSSGICECWLCDWLC